MTIAAGFRYVDGALLCADTKHSGQMALYDPKLFPKEYSNGARSIFAIVGSSSYAKMGVRKCEAALGALKNPVLVQMENAIESALLAMHKKHIYPHPDRNMQGGPDFWLLAALWSPVDGLRTYHTVQTAIDPFDVYFCAGSGDYLGHYIIKPRYQNSTGGLTLAVSVASTALQRIKTYDADCGGNSQFITLSNSGQIGNMGERDISQREEFTEGFHEYAEFLYEHLCDLDLPEDQVNNQFNIFKDVVLKIRIKHQRDRDTRKLLAETIATPAKQSVSQTSKPAQ